VEREKGRRRGGDGGERVKCMKGMKEVKPMKE
jgi:hypothetical protein